MFPIVCVCVCVRAWVRVNGANVFIERLVSTRDKIPAIYIVFKLMARQGIWCALTTSTHDIFLGFLSGPDTSGETNQIENGILFRWNEPCHTINYSADWRSFAYFMELSLQLEFVVVVAVPFINRLCHWTWAICCNLFCLFNRNSLHVSINQFKLTYGPFKITRLTFWGNCSGLSGGGHI